MTYIIIGIQLDDLKNEFMHREKLDELRFITEVSSLSYERLYLEEINSHIIINEEQDRISNEIHDTVIQQLFSISCCLYGLKEKLIKLSTTEIEDEIDNINVSLNKTKRMLRETIYGLNTRKNGKFTFYEDVKDYINNLSKMNNIKISLNINGKEEMIRRDIKKAIYRMICESTGNAINHGKCSEIKIDLSIDDNRKLLRIWDNGIGFNVEDTLINEKRGLGIRNVTSLVKFLNGEILINSTLGEGTLINIELPNSLSDSKKREAIG